MPQTPAANDRFNRGIALLQRIGGRNYDQPLQQLADIAPELARYMVEFCYGDVLAGDGLDLPTRQLVTIASLMAQGSVQPQLIFHMNGYLNANGDVGELVELLYLAVPVLGFTAAINAVPLVRDIFQARGIQLDPASRATDDGTARLEHGLGILRELTQSTEDLRELERLSPDFARWTVEFFYGEVLFRTNLQPRQRQLIIIAMLATLGNRDDALRLHLTAGLRNGVSRQEMIEALMQLAVYAGFPKTLNAFALIKRILAEDSQDTTEAPSAYSPAWTSESRKDRQERGLVTLAATSAQSGRAVVNSFDDIAPDIGRAIIEHSYGDIFCRSGLEPKIRELTTCAALAAVATKTMETPLRVHLNAAITAGAGRTEIIETLLNLLPYCGYPVVERALRIADVELAQRGI